MSLGCMSQKLPTYGFKSRKDKFALDNDYDEASNKRSVVEVDLKHAKELHKLNSTQKNKDWKVWETYE